jgi:ferric-dicitrate binding protein FerR (iron transport regulator)
MEQDQFITLLNKYLQGQLSAAENRQFQELLQSDTKNQVLFDFLRIKPSQKEQVDNSEEVFQSVLKKIESSEISTLLMRPHDEDHATEHAHLSPNKKPWYQNYRNVAAVLLPLFLILSLWIYNSQTQTRFSEQYSSKKGEKKIINLSDGTTVWLNGDSKLFLEHSFGKAERRVKLEGEGFFTVAHDRSHPFIVEFRNSEVKVLGTRFNIRAYPDEDKTETSLVEGSIELKAAHQVKSFMLKPGDKIALLPAKAVPAIQTEANPKIQVQHSTLIIPEGEQAPSETLWMYNKLSFNADPMSLIVSKLSKWYNVSIQIENPALEQITFSGNLEGYSLDQVLALLKQANPSIEIKRQNESIILQ